MRVGLGLGIGSVARGRVLRVFDFRTTAHAGAVFSLPSWLAIACATTSTDYVVRVVKA